MTSFLWIYGGVGGTVFVVAMLAIGAARIPPDPVAYPFYPTIRDSYICMGVLASLLAAHKRERVYPRLVETGRLTAAGAAHEIAAMKARNSAHAADAPASRRRHAEGELEALRGA